MNGVTPGSFVRNPSRPDWGLGQVQSVVGTRVTANFEHAGKLLIITELVALERCDIPVPDAERPR